MGKLREIIRYETSADVIPRSSISLVGHIGWRSRESVLAVTVNVLEYSTIIGDMVSNGIEYGGDICLALGVTCLSELTERVHGDEHNRREDGEHTYHDEYLYEREPFD